MIIGAWVLANIDSRIFEIKPNMKNTIATVLIRNVVRSELTEMPRLPNVKKVMVNIANKAAMCLEDSNKS